MENNEIDSGSGQISSQSFNDLIHNRDVISFTKAQSKMANEDLRKANAIKEQQAAEKELEQ